MAQGTNTIIATKMGLSLSNYVVTEAGFGADLGAEKFLNIKCASAGLNPKAVVLVATIRALRHHGGASKEEFNSPSLEYVQKGFCNLEKHIENIRKFNISLVKLRGERHLMDFKFSRQFSLLGRSVARLN